MAYHTCKTVMYKVLHIIDSGGFYGAEIMLLNLMQEQIKQGLEPVIASIGGKNFKEKPVEKQAISRGFKVKKFRMLPGPNLAGALKILGYAKKTISIFCIHMGISRISYSAVCQRRFGTFRLFQHFMDIRVQRDTVGCECMNGLIKKV